MASSEPAPVERLTAADLPACLALSAEASWNQVQADWQVFFDHGAVWGIRRNDRLVASAALLPFPPKTAWVSMVLTSQAARGQGFASRLAAAAVAECTMRGLDPQLDATPAGEALYNRLGFQTLARLTRWRRGSQGTDLPALVPEIAQGGLDRIGHLDAQAIGFERPDLLRSLLGRGPSVTAEAAFALSRDGRTAHQIGPLVAVSWEAAEAVLAKLLARVGTDQAIIIDANDEARELADCLDARGFKSERPFRRMAKGSAPRADPSRYFAVAGPEFG